MRLHRRTRQTHRSPANVGVIRDAQNSPEPLGSMLPSSACTFSQFEPSTARFSFCATDGATRSLLVTQMFPDGCGIEPPSQSGR